jgi:hypothetical protein
MMPLSTQQVFERFRISAKGRAPIRDFIVTALRECGCNVLHEGPQDEAPFTISFVTPWNERMGIVAYAFTANTRITKNRPEDEHRFQVKYGSNDRKVHSLWQDPFNLYTTLFLGINADREFFVGADPVLNSPTKFFISKEFKEAHAQEIAKRGWYSWEREQRRDSGDEPHEVLVGGTLTNFLRYVLFEREARGEDQGHRQLLAENFGKLPADVASRPLPASVSLPLGAEISPDRLHALEREFDLSAPDILQLIESAPRLKMAVRGWVAEKHLQKYLETLPDVTEIKPLEADGRPDFEVRVKGGRKPVLLECKNVLRSTTSSGLPRLDFMRTRSSQSDPCSRFYSADDFAVIAACLHARTEKWDFASRLTRTMTPHAKCLHKLAARITVDDTWSRDLGAVLRAASA